MTLLGFLLQPNGGIEACTVHCEAKGLLFCQHQFVRTFDSYRLDIWTDWIMFIFFYFLFMFDLFFMFFAFVYHVLSLPIIFYVVSWLTCFLAATSSNEHLEKANISKIQRSRRNERKPAQPWKQHEIQKSTMNIYIYIYDELMLFPRRLLLRYWLISIRLCRRQSISLPSSAWLGDIVGMDGDAGWTTNSHAAWFI